MALSPAQEALLDDLLTELPDDVTWACFGSVDSVCRGLDDDPNDVDVLTTTDGVGAFRATFPESHVETWHVGVSRIDEFRLRGEELEVISPDPDAEGDPLVDFGAVERRRTDERGVPLLPLEPLVDAYRRIGKDETADRLAAAFETGD